MKNKDFRRLVRVRRWVSNTFLLFLLALYLLFSLLSVYAPEVLAEPVFSNGVVPFGIVLGYAILAMIFILTLVYVRLANHFFEPLEKNVMASIKRGLKR